MVSKAASRSQPVFLCARTQESCSYFRCTTLFTRSLSSTSTVTVWPGRKCLPSGVLTPRVSAHNTYVSLPAGTNCSSSPRWLEWTSQRAFLSRARRSFTVTPYTGRSSGPPTVPKIAAEFLALSRCPACPTAGRTKRTTRQEKLSGRDGDLRDAYTQLETT